MTTQTDLLPLESTAEAETSRAPKLGLMHGSASFPVLAHKDGIGLMLGLLVHQGAMCSKCGYGTRATSKRWAVCKKCGERVERRALPNAQDEGADK